MEKKGHDGLVGEDMIEQSCCQTHIDPALCGLA
jgi:hypothetical protein